MNRLRKILALSVFSLIAMIKPSTIVAQVQDAKDALSAIYKVYDSLKYLTFDVSYTYDTDTLYGDFTHDVLNGTYTMNGKKAFYKLGDIDFMQNESFLIAVYHKDKFMIVSDPQQPTAGGYLPMRTQLDSLFKTAIEHYNVSLTNGVDEVTGKPISNITLIAIDSGAQFKNYTISYESSSKYLRSLQYSFVGGSDNYATYDTLSDTARKRILNVPRKKQLTIKFLKYRFENLSKDIYDENSYIFLEDDKYRPISKYNDYKLYYTKTSK